MCLSPLGLEQVQNDTNHPQEPLVHSVTLGPLSKNVLEVPGLMLLTVFMIWVMGRLTLAEEEGDSLSLDGSPGHTGNS